MIEIFGLIAGLSAIMVITETNTVHSVFYLVLSFISTSIIFILAELDYLGLLVIIIYVGAIAILFLFVVMMINIKVEDQNKARYVPIGVAITLGFIYQAYSAYPKFHEPLIKYDKREEWIAMPDVVLYNPHDYISETGGWFVNDIQNNMNALGQVLYSWPLIMTSSLVLLVAMIGAIVLTLSHSKGVKRQDLFNSK